LASKSQVMLMKAKHDIREIITDKKLLAAYGSYKAGDYSSQAVKDARLEIIDQKFSELVQLLLVERSLLQVLNARLAAEGKRTVLKPTESNPRNAALLADANEAVDEIIEEADADERNDNNDADVDDVENRRPSIRRKTREEPLALKRMDSEDQ
jgi:hypothetical protein